MLLLYAIAFGLLLGRLSGGSLRGLESVRFAWWPLALGGLAFQVLLFAEPVASRVGALGPVLYVASTIVVLLALLANLRQPGMPVVLAGALANLTAIVSNGGLMPSSPDAWMALNGVRALPTDDFTNAVLMGPDTWFPFLGDVFVLPRPIPLATVFSIGDVLIAIGAVVFLVSAMRRPVAVPSGAVTPSTSTSTAAAAPTMAPRNAVPDR